MQKFQFGRDLDITPERSWEIFFDVEFNKELCASLDLEEYTVLECEEDDRTYHISRRYITKREVPNAIKRMTGATKLGYVTEETWDKKKNSLRWNFIPIMFDEGVEGTGNITCEVMPDGRTRRTFKGVVEADLPIIGDQLEIRMTEVFEESYEKGIALFKKFIERDKADLAAGKGLRPLTRPGPEDVQEAPED